MEAIFVLPYKRNDDNDLCRSLAKQCNHNDK